MTSTSSSVSRTRSLSRWPSSVRGLCSPGVSTRISWLRSAGDDAADGVPGRLRLARRDRDLAADQRVGQRRLAGVRPPDEAREARDVAACSCSLIRPAPPSPARCLGRLDPLDDDGRDAVAATRHPLGGQAQPCHLAGGAEDRHPADASCRCSPPTVSTSSSSRSTSNSSPRSSTCSVAGDPQPAVAEVLDLGGLAVVLVGDLADDLLEDVLDRHQAGGAAVLVDDDGEVGLVALHLAQQVVDRLALGHEAASGASARRPAPPRPRGRR